MKFSTPLLILVTLISLSICTSTQNHEFDNQEQATIIDTSKITTSSSHSILDSLNNPIVVNNAGHHDSDEKAMGNNMGIEFIGWDEVQRCIEDGSCAVMKVGGGI